MQCIFNAPLAGANARGAPSIDADADVRTVKKVTSVPIEILRKVHDLNSAATDRHLMGKLKTDVISFDCASTFFSLSKY